MAAVGLIADIDREVAALETNIAVAANGWFVAAAIHAGAGHLVDFAAVRDI
jgi:hypothetical protein